MKTTEELKIICRNSAFNRNNYEVNIPLNNMINFLGGYVNPIDNPCKEYTTEEFFAEAIPEFQRTNDKWSEQMQRLFVENVLKGFDTSLLFGSIIKNGRLGSYDSCFVIDGYQRLTALAQFLDGKLDIFGGMFVSDFDDIILRRMSKLKIRIYEFADINDTINFYIEMNENITHSKEDIEKARKFLI